MEKEKNNMDIKKISEKLKEVRKTKGYTLEDVYKVTKISIMNLDAIENGNFDLLPHPVYTKAFIKTYAQFLEIDPADILKAYETYLEKSKKEKLPKTKLKSYDKGSNRTVLLLISIIILLMVLVSVTYFYIQKKQVKSDQIPRENLSLEKSQYNNTNNTEELHSKNNKDLYSAINNTQGNFTETPKTESANNATEKNNINDMGEQQIIEQKELSIKQEEQKNDLKITDKMNYVEIKANDDCWIGAQIDGQRKKEVFLRKGNSITFEYKDYLEIKFGNLGGVEIYNNGEKLDIKGKPGEVKIIKIPIDE